MSTFIYTTQKDFEGPWLVSREALNELGEIFERISGGFEDEAKKQIEIDVKADLENYPKESQSRFSEGIRERISLRHALQKTVNLTLSTSKYLQGETIKEILANPELQDEAPTGLEVEIGNHNRSARLQLGGRYYNSSQLSISTSPETDSLSREAFSDLQHWAVLNQPPLWQKIWDKVVPFNWFIWLLMISILSTAIASNSNNLDEHLAPIANELLSDGISVDEIPSAIEILLRYETNIAPQESETTLPKWFYVIFFGGLAANIIISIRPKMVIGIGRNKNRLFLWRKWTTFAGITVPGILFASFIWPYIVEWLKSTL